MRFSKAYLKLNYSNTYKAFGESDYIISDRPLFTRLENFLDSKDFYFSCEPIFNQRGTLKGHSVNVKLKDQWRHLDDTSLKSTEKIKKLYMSALLNEFEKFLVFGSV